MTLVMILEETRCSYKFAVLLIFIPSRENLYTFVLGSVYVFFWLKLKLCAVVSNSATVVVCIAGLKPVKRRINRKQQKKYIISMGVKKK